MVIALTFVPINKIDECIVALGMELSNELQELLRHLRCLSQNMHKHLDALGLIREYSRKADFTLKAKTVIALAYVPINKINECIDALGMELSNERQELLNWFEDTYVRRANRIGNGKRTPLCDPEV